MQAIRTLFEVNSQIILFVYGLSFFVLGLAIALQSRRYSQLDLARSLPWLAAFGIMHSLNEWGDLFIPIQRSYLGEPQITLLYVMQLVLLAVSFACLLEFGLALLRPGRQARLFHSLVIGLLFAWAFIIFFVVLPLAPDLATWFREANALGRYFIGFPAGLTAAYSLRKQALDRIARLNAPHIVAMLRIAGFTLAPYALFAGLVPPPVPFFPGSWVNTRSFTETVGIPVLVFRSAIGFVLAIAIIRTLEIFELETERFIEAMEQQQILAAERDRIGRELHDGVIQKVYSAGLLIESTYKQCPTDSTISTRLDKAQVVLNDAIADLRRNLGELRAVPSGRPLYDALAALAADPRFQSLVDLQLNLALPNDDPLTPGRADDVMAIVNEALSNIVRHARARRVKIAACREMGRLKLAVQDDGIGLPRPLAAGFGLRNMRDRARLLGGEIEFISGNGKGTTVQLDIPWRDER